MDFNTLDDPGADGEGPQLIDDELMTLVTLNEVLIVELVTLVRTHRYFAAGLKPAPAAMTRSYIIIRGVLTIP